MNLVSSFRFQVSSCEEVSFTPRFSEVTENEDPIDGRFNGLFWKTVENGFTGNAALRITLLKQGENEKPFSLRLLKTGC